MRASEEGGCHHIIPEHNQDRRKNHGLRRGFAHPFGSESCVITFIARNPCNQNSKTEGFVHSHENIFEVEVVCHFSKVGAFADVQEVDSDKITSEDTDDIEDGGEEGKGNNSCHGLWDTEVER